MKIRDDAVDTQTHEAARGASIVGKANLKVTTTGIAATAFVSPGMSFNKA